MCINAYLFYKQWPQLNECDKVHLSHTSIDIVYKTNVFIVNNLKCPHI